MSVPRATPRGARRRVTRRRATLCGDCRERERRPGQWNCRECHAAGSRHYRQQRAARVAAERAELAALRAQVHEKETASA